MPPGEVLSRKLQLVVPNAKNDAEKSSPSALLNIIVISLPQSRKKWLLERSNLLNEVRQMVVDNHVHLENGPYTLDWLEEFLQEADKQGVDELGITEHFYRFVEAKPCLYNEQIAAKQTEHLEEYLELMARAKQKGWPVKTGLEVDYIPEKEKEIRQALKGLPLDLVIGSVHWLGDWCFDVDPATWEDRDLESVYREYYDVLAQAVESRLFDVLGHPGNIAYFGHRADLKVVTAIENEWLTRIRRSRIAIEVNTGGLLREARSLFPRVDLLKRVRVNNFDISLGSDAHWPKDVGHAFSETRQLLKQFNFDCIYRFHKRKGRLVALS